MANHRYSNKSQIYWMCRALTQGRTINHMDEIGEVRGWRLGAIIHNLRRNYDWPIHTEYKVPERIAHYSLKVGEDWRGLAFPRSARKQKSELGDG